MSNVSKLFGKFSPGARSKQPGLSPGSMIFTGRHQTGKLEISLFDYSEKSLKQVRPKKVRDCIKYKDTGTTTWVNINGLHETRAIAELGQGFGLHPLTLEDIVNTTQRPKMEEYDSYIYLVLKMISYAESARDIQAEQISIIVGRNFVLSFQERPGDILDPVRKRLISGKGFIRAAGADYLAYAMMDAIVDEYFTVLEKFGEDIEEVETELVRNPEPVTLRHINQLKKEAMYLRKSVWPLRELVNGLERLESGLFRKQTRVYLRDLYDHTMQVIDNTETMREVLSGMVDIYLSSASNKMNEVMKVLTIIATIFIPITFLTGVYGMNFQYFPELDLPWAYPIFWLVVAIVIVFMLAYFKRKRWL